MFKITKRRTASLIATAALVVGVVAPATADDPFDYEPEFIEEQNWFQCDGTTKVSNANTILGDAYPSWSTTAPAASVQDGAGCGGVEQLPLQTADGAHGNVYDVTWEGTFTGNIQDAMVELHTLSPLPSTPLYGGVGLDILVSIDGVAQDVGEQFLDADWSASATGASHSLRFAINGIDIVDDPMGPGDVTHTYTISAKGYYADSGMVVPFAWGTTEVPAGITFNADTSGLPEIRL